MAHIYARVVLGAYLDCYGSIGVWPTKYSKNSKTILVPRIMLSSRQAEIAGFAHRHFPGSLTLVDRKGIAKQFRWTAANRQALDVALKVLPYVNVEEKREKLRSILDHYWA